MSPRSAARHYAPLPELKRAGAGGVRPSDVLPPAWARALRVEAFNRVPPTHASPRKSERVTVLNPGGRMDRNGFEMLVVPTNRAAWIATSTNTAAYLSESFSIVFGATQVAALK